MKYTQLQLELPLMQTLNELGGKARTKEIYDELANKIHLTEEERTAKIANSNTHRMFDRNVRWVKQNLKLNGLISGDTEHGVWQLTEKAKSFLKNAKPGYVITVYEVVNDRGDTLGVGLWGEVTAACGVLEKGMINLVLTSPPYCLSSPMEYGNKSEGKEYINWFMPIAEELYKLMDDSASLVLNLGSCFKKGVPVKSLYQYELILSLCNDLGFHLAQDFYWHSDSKLPTSPWVTVDRIRVKASVENIYWLSKSPYPKANNRNILVPYSDSYKKVLSKGGYGVYNSRPSGQKIDHFNRDNHGSIPGNLIVASNSVSNDKYMTYCKENNIPIHPARMPGKLAEYFIKFLSDPGDIVYDCFAGSNTVGEEAIKLGRRFIATDKSLTYLQGSVGRFNLDNVRLFPPLVLT